MRPVELTDFMESSSLDKLTEKIKKKRTKMIKMKSELRSESELLFPKKIKLLKQNADITKSKTAVGMVTRKLPTTRPKRQSEAFECPSADGFFPHQEQCDAYWSCLNWESQLRLCGNGLAFDDTLNSTTKEHCDYLFAVDCGHRVLLGILSCQPFAKSLKECRQKIIKEC